MREHPLVATVRKCVEPLIEARGLCLWGIEIEQAGKTNLRIYIDAKTNDLDKESPGVALDQCEALSRDIGLTLDVEDVFPNAWVLEVSTPGLSRSFFSLEQMKPYVGDVVEVRLYTSYPSENGRKFWRGLLESVNENSVTIAPVSIDDEDFVTKENRDALTLLWENVRCAQRRALFPKPQKPGKGSRQK